jgi:toxin-antitoxin system PIN domain toxin
MKLVDANVLLYAVNEDAPRHKESRKWLDDALSGGARVGFAWIVLLAFVRLSTKAGVFPRPLTIAEAFQIVEVWLDQPAAVVVEPTARHLSVCLSLLQSSGIGGNLVNDAHLGALAIEHHGQIVSFDRDFGRLDGVRWEMPPKLSKLS